MNGNNQRDFDVAKVCHCLLNSADVCHCFLSLLLPTSSPPCERGFRQPEWEFLTNRGGGTRHIRRSTRSAVLSSSCSCCRVFPSPEGAQVNSPRREPRVWRVLATSPEGAEVRRRVIFRPSGAGGAGRLTHGLTPVAIGCRPFGTSTIRSAPMPNPKCPPARYAPKCGSQQALKRCGAPSTVEKHCSQSSGTPAHCPTGRA